MKTQWRSSFTGKTMIGLDESFGNYVKRMSPEHKTEETAECLIEKAGIHQTFSVYWVCGS